MGIHLRDNTPIDITPEKPKKLQDKVIGFTGAYPNLCSGAFILLIDNKEYDFEGNSLRSEGGLDENYDAHEGPWSVSKWPKGFPKELKEKALDIINNDIPHGCCGGCA